METVVVSDPPDIRAGRLPPHAYADNFADAHPPLSRHQALVESDRCLFCHDAPCVTACPTSIDIPSFIHKIASGNVKGAAQDILGQNIMGAVCARVCPTEVLCEGSCVRHTPEDRPVAIGALQRHATDWLFDRGIQLFRAGPPTGKRVAVVGGGPAGLSCAHKLAQAGHAVTVFEARGKAGGLNEYGIAAYKLTDGIPQREVDYLLAVGNIELQLGKRLGHDIDLATLQREFDAVFLGIGLAAVNSLGLPGEQFDGVHDAVAYIEQLRQSDDLASLPVGRQIVVIGGGMTAIDIATQTRRLGAEDVTIVYRRGPDHMGASDKEQRWAQVNGVRIRHWARPARLLVDGTTVRGVEFERTRLGADGRLTGTGDHYALPADMVFKAIGQLLVPDPLHADHRPIVDLIDGRIAVDAERRTSLPNVWAGGDCVSGGPDLTVAAVEDGKQAALSIDRFLRGAP
ncbi:MAG: NAD(P)-dependent oxidoreductase [Burkholderiales bacterium]|nr:NAD(P)-dependent oxidoreductase [Burkholderiales bacterium]